MARINGNLTVTGNITSENLTILQNSEFLGTVTVPDPINGTEAANRRYVDVAIDNLQSTIQNTQSIGLDGAKKYSFYEDFVSSLGNIGSNSGWNRLVSGTGAAVDTIQGEIGHPGIIRATTGTSTTGYAGISYSTTPSIATESIYVGGGRIIINMVCRVPVLGTVTTNEAVLRCGMADEINDLPNNGIYMSHIYSDGVMKWCPVVRIDGVGSIAVGPPVVANRWTPIRIEITDTGSSASFFIDDILITTITNLPLVGMTFIHQAKKFTGTTPILFDIDVFEFTQLFSDERWNNSTILEETPRGSFITITGTAGEVIQGNRIVKLGPDGKYYKASSSLVGDGYLVVGMAMNSALPNTPVQITISGLIEESSWNYIAGLPAFLGTDGLITQIPPTSPTKFRLSVGHFTFINSLYFSVGTPIFLEG